MQEAYQLAFNHSMERKTKDIIRINTKRPCLTTLEPGSRVACNFIKKQTRTTLPYPKKTEVIIQAKLKFK